MAPPTVKNDAAAATQKQLLTLVQAKGNAEKALALLLQSAIAKEEPARSSLPEKATALLRLAVLESQALRSGDDKGALSKRDLKKETKEGSKQWALVAAKVAQSVIKLYLGATPAGAPAKNDEDNDAVSALDLATLALAIYCQYEGLVKLGDLVLENMLYQVAKKLSEMPKRTASSLLIFAAIHLRLWHHHAVLCTQLNHPATKETSPIGKRVDQLLQSTGASKKPLLLDELADLCTFPSPQSFHTMQFTRFLISVVNAAVNVLLPASKHEATLKVAKMADPWICHLSRIPGVDAKLPASFSDRLFRVLWKCAAAADAEKPTGTVQDASLEYRSVALSFMLKCPSYSNAYFIQQVHRVGVQYEKKHASGATESATDQLCDFYSRSANALLKLRDVKSSPIEWDYLHWLEHFVSVCDAQKSMRRDVEALAVLRYAMDYLSVVEAQATNSIIAGCFQALGGCIIAERRLASVTSSAASEKDIQKTFEGDQFLSRIKPDDRDLVVAALGSTTRKQAPPQWVEAATVYLNGLSTAREAVHNRLTGWSDTHSNFVLRTVRKVSTRLFSTATASNLCPSNVTDLIVSAVVCARDILSSLREAEPALLSSALKESFLAAEGRICRLVVAIGANRALVAADEECLAGIETMEQNISKFQRVMNEAMTEPSSRKESLPSLIGDLQGIARDAYRCATHFYKKNQHAMVVKSLEAAFALAENYLEHVLCDEQMSKTPEQVSTAHRNLKADAIASLLAYSLHQAGALSQARQCYGHAILYTSDPAGISQNGAIDKYVHAVMEEFKSQGESMSEDSCVVVVKSLCESLALAWKARGLDVQRVSAVVQLLGGAFNRFATRTLDRLRTKTEASDDDDATNQKTCRVIRSCGALESVLRQHVWDGNSSLSRQVIASGVSVVNALGKRRCAFGEYYAHRNIVEAVAGLRAAHTEIAVAIGQLERVHSEYLIDIGGCYGWRGVIALEICQMMQYAAARNERLPDELQIEESSALDDIKECLSRWQGIAFDDAERTSTLYFDAPAAATCLDAVSHALSLMSHTQLESQARSLLCRIKGTQAGGSEDADFATSLPSLMLQPEHVSYDGIRYQDAEKNGECEAAGILRLQVVDAEIGLCLTSTTSCDTAQAHIHHVEAAKMMQDVRAMVKISPENSHLFSAVAMRELALGMAASEIKFQEGDILQAIREAKSALSICWKISKKVGVSESHANGYELPEAVTAALGKHAEQSQKASQLIYFQAMECWSWDVLLAAKLILSRIASLYALNNQPYRSSIYYAEAMTLVGSVVPATTRNRPFFEFAQLQILAERTNHASAIHQLLTLDGEPLTEELESPSDNLDVSVLTQHCEVRLQRGDLCLLEGDSSQARASYESALQLLEAMARRTPAANSVACGCYRRMAKLHTQAPSSEDTVDELLHLLKGLRRAIKKCSDIIEYALGTCQLVQSSLLLLRSGSSRAFLPAEKLAETMEEVFLRCDHLNIPHVRQEIRLVAGNVYLLLSESPSTAPDERRRTTRLATSLLSNYHVIRSLPQQQHPADTVTSPRSVMESLPNTAGTALSPSWLIASLAVSESSRLSISLTPGDGSEPVSFWIGNAAWDECIQELGAIIEASRVTLFGNKPDAAEEWTAEKKKTWWNTRKDLDNQLGALVTKMQKTLGFWRALLNHVPNLRLERNPVIDDVSELLFDSSRALTFRSQWLLSAVASSNALLTDGELLQCVDHVAIEENVRIDAEQARKIVDILRRSDPRASDAETSTILILHHHLEQFPWEGLDVLCARAVTRMPSIDLIMQNAQKVRAKSAAQSSSISGGAVDPDRVAYLLNPGGDLKTTQSTLEPIFQRGEADRGWQGTSGSIPDEETIRNYLVGSDLFVYCGHGSGEKYFHRDKIEALRDQQCAAALLFGCSSGRLEREGVFGPNGAVLSYLEAGSSAVLAMLWDVTDKDIDLVSKDILENWLLTPADASGSPVALSAALQRARRLCKLQNLNGLAAVCYGLPLFVAAREPNTPSQSKRRRLK